MAELRGRKTAEAPADSGRQRTIEDWLGDPFFAASIERILPRHLTSERFAAVAMRSFRAVPGLLQCTPASVLAGLIDSAQLGLEIGLGGECWLLPYNTRVKGRNGEADSWQMVAQLQIGYLGHLKLAWQSGQVASVEANVATHEEVAAGRFEYQHGTNGFLHHRPVADRDVSEKTVAYAYACVWVKGSDRPVWRVLDARQIARLRETGKSANSPAWTNWFDEMAMAKALKRALKWTPKARELAHAISIDDEADAGAPQTYQSAADVAGLLSASGVRSEEQKAMQDAMDRANQRKPGAGGAGDPGPGDGEAGTPPPIPAADAREKVPVAARRAAPPRPSAAGESDEGLGF